MRSGSFILFFTIVLTIYGLINTYIFSKGLQAIPPGSAFRVWYIIGFWFLVCTFILGRILDRAGTSGLSTVLTWTGSFWLGAMLYFLLIVLCIDFARVLDHVFHVFPSIFYADWQQAKLYHFFILGWPCPRVDCRRTYKYALSEDQETGSYGIKTSENLRKSASRYGFGHSSRNHCREEPGSLSC